MRKVYNRPSGKTYLYMTVSFTGDSRLAKRVERACMIMECSESELAKRALKHFLDSSQIELLDQK